jgi:ATP-dependent helicase HrpA
MVAELVETTRLWGRTAAAVDIRQIEPLAEHLVKRSYGERSYGEPRSDRRRAAVVASEQVTLYGLAIVESRTVQYGRIDPAAARELFIRRALVEGDWDQRHAFMRENERRVEEVEALEARARRRDLLARWKQGSLELALSYRFDPGSAADGVTVQVPLASLGAVPETNFEWLVPAFRMELVVALLRTLPKRLRTALVPIPDTATALLAAIPFP